MFTQIRSNLADFLVCLTVNGIVRWTIYVEPVADMDPIGVSNIVSDSEGNLFYTISWSGDTIYTAKICRITHAQTLSPIQKCFENAQLFMYINSPLALDEKYHFLITAVSDNQFESVPALLNKTNLNLLWVNRHYFGAGMNGEYRYDRTKGDLFWIAGDDRLLKFNYKGQHLINNYTQLGGSGLDFVLDQNQEILVRPWTNMTSLHWKNVVSSHNVSAEKIELRWNWYPPSSIDDDRITAPTIDQNGTIYLSSMPFAFAIDYHGKTLWKTRLATSTEMTKYNLVSICVTINIHRQILYILSGSAFYQKSYFLYFLTAIDINTGHVIKRIDLNLANDKQITAQCPILIGDEMLYFSWLTGAYPQLVPFQVTAFQQL